MVDEDRAKVYRALSYIQRARAILEPRESIHEADADSELEAALGLLSQVLAPHGPSKGRDANG